MQHVVLSAIAIGCAALALSACKQAPSTTNGPHRSAPIVIEKLSVPQVARLLASSHPPAVYDANGQETRAKYGTLPGAKLLSSASQYDPDQMLPKDHDEKLVFYCACEACSAAKTAAKRAVSAGWTDVSVMPAGIAGWSAAGKTRNQS